MAASCANSPAGSKGSRIRHHLRRTAARPFRRSSSPSPSGLKPPGFSPLLRPKETQVTYEDQGAKQILMESDDFFAWQLKRSGIATLAADQGIQPISLFATQALAVADIFADRDSDGILRRVKAFRMYRKCTLVPAR